MEFYFQACCNNGTAPCEIFMEQLAHLSDTGAAPADGDGHTITLAKLVISPAIQRKIDYSLTKSFVAYCDHEGEQRPPMHSWNSPWTQGQKNNRHWLIWLWIVKAGRESTRWLYFRWEKMSRYKWIEVLSNIFLLCSSFTWRCRQSNDQLIDTKCSGSLSSVAWCLCCKMPWGCHN